MCMETTTAGAFQGFGKTVPPSVTGILFNTLRIPVAYAAFGHGSWAEWCVWTLSLSCVLKGLVLPAWFLIVFVKYYKSGKDKF